MESPVIEKEVRTARRKTRIGKVVSDSMEKSIVVLVEQRLPHRVYKKFYTKSKKLMVHDEKQEAKTGDLVKIMETRPLSGRKRWRLVEIVKRAK